MSESKNRAICDTMTPGAYSNALYVYHLYLEGKTRVNDVHGNDTALHVNHSDPSLAIWWNASSWSKHLDKLAFFDVDIRIKRKWPQRRAFAYKSEVRFP